MTDPNFLWVDPERLVTFLLFLAFIGIVVFIWIGIYVEGKHEEKQARLAKEKMFR